MPVLIGVLWARTKTKTDVYHATVLAIPAQAPPTRIACLAHQGIGYTTTHVNRVNWAIFMIHPNLLASHAMPLAAHAVDRLAQIVFLVKPNYI